MKVYDTFEQGTPEWHQVRLGKATASEFSKATAGGHGKTRKKYMYELLAERLTGEVQEGYRNGYMDWGKENEPRARAFYSLETGNDVAKIGFAEHNENIGASPDGLIGENGLLEIKCPKSTTHIEYLLSDTPPSEYKKQILGEMWVCEREWVDFVSFDPRNRVKDYHCIRVYRDEEQIEQLRDGIYAFVDELIALENKLCGDIERLLRESIESSG